MASLFIIGPAISALIAGALIALLTMGSIRAATMISSRIRRH